MKPRYEICARETWDDEFDNYWEHCKKMEPYTSALTVAPYQEECPYNLRPDDGHRPYQGYL